MRGICNGGSCSLGGSDVGEGRCGKVALWKSCSVQCNVMESQCGGIVVCETVVMCGSWGVEELRAVVAGRCGGLEWQA